MLKVSQVATMLGIHRNTVIRWADKGYLKSYRIGPRGDRRFDRADVMAVLKKGGPY